jgi:anti-sigma B factor antagonist
VAFAYAVDRADGQVTIVLAGEADHTAADQLRRVLFDAVAQRPTGITVDVRGLVFIDSSGIGTLVAARRAALERHCAFLVTKPQGQVLHVLRVAGVLTALTRTVPPGEAGGIIGAMPCA